MAKDETGLSWSGAPKPVRTGGFVGSVSMNADTKARLAVDPDGVVARRESRREAGGTTEGAAVDVQVLKEKPDPRERPKGRFKMPVG